MNGGGGGGIQILFEKGCAAESLKLNHTYTIFFFKKEWPMNAHLIILGHFLREEIWWKEGNEFIPRYNIIYKQILQFGEWFKLKKMLLLIWTYPLYLKCTCRGLKSRVKICMPITHNHMKYYRPRSLSLLVNDGNKNMHTRTQEMFYCDNE